MRSVRLSLSGRARYAALALVLAVAMPTVLLVSSSAADSAKGALEQWLPPSTLALVTVPNLHEAKDAWHKTAVWKIWQDEEVKQALEPTREALDKQWDKFTDKFQEKTGQKFDDVLDILDGQVSLAVIDLPGTKDKGPEKLDLVLAIDCGDHKDRAEKLVAKGKEEILKENKDLQEGSYAFKGTTIGTLGGKELTMHWTFVGNTFLFGTQKKTIEGVVAAATDGLPASLATDPEFTKFRAATGQGKESFLAYVNGDALYKRYEPEMTEDAVRIIDGLGLRGVKSFGATVTLAEDDVKDVVYIHAPGVRKGIPKILSFPSAAPRDLSIVPKDAVALSVMNVDLAQTYADVIDTVHHVVSAEEKADVDDKIAKTEDELGFRFDDLFSSIGTQWVSYVAMPEAGGAWPDMVSAIELRDPAKFEACMKGLAAEKKDAFRSLPFQGETIHYLVISKPPERTGPAWMASFGNSPIAYFVKGKTLYYSESTLALRRLILATGRGGQTIKDNPLWQQSSARLSGPQGILAYYDLGKLFTIAFNTVEPIGTYFQGFLNEAGIPLDLQRMPLGETLGKYVAQTIVGVTSDAEGIRIEDHSPVGFSLVGVAGTGVVAALTLPALAAARASAKKRDCTNNLRQLGTYMVMYVGKYGNNTNYPGPGIRMFTDLFNLPSPEKAIASGNESLLICKEAGDKLDIDLVRQNDPDCSSYECIDQKLSDGTTRPEWPIAWDKRPHADGTRNVLFFSGSVQQMTEEEFQKALKQWPGK